jgi:hypothetical protein
VRERCVRGIVCVCVCVFVRSRVWPCIWSRLRACVHAVVFVCACAHRSMRTRERVVRVPALCVPVGVPPCMRATGRSRVNGSSPVRARVSMRSCVRKCTACVREFSVLRCFLASALVRCLMAHVCACARHCHAAAQQRRRCRERRDAADVVATRRAASLRVQVRVRCRVCRVRMRVRTHARCLTGGAPVLARPRCKRRFARACPQQSARRCGRWRWGTAAMCVGGLGACFLAYVSLRAGDSRHV